MKREIYKGAESVIFRPVKKQAKNFDCTFDTSKKGVKAITCYTTQKREILIYKSTSSYKSNLNLYARF